MHFPVAVESWILLAHSWVELILRLTDYKYRLQLPCMSCCAGSAPEKKFFPGRSGACWNPPLGVPLVWLVGLISGVVWSPTLVVLVLAPLRRVFGAGQCQTLCVTGLGLPVWSYHAFHPLWLCLLGLGVYGRGQVLYKVWLPAALSWGHINKRSKAPWSQCPHVGYSVPFPPPPLRSPGLPPEPFERLQSGPKLLVIHRPTRGKTQ